MYGSVGRGLKTVVIPSNVDALTERLDLLLASHKAGNTGVRNEVISIFDELLRQGELNKSEYKKNYVAYIKNDCNKKQTFK